MILVIDDDEVIRRSLRILLTAEGYQVEIANDGRDALRKLEVITPTMILFDITMTPEDGLAFIKTLIQVRKEKESLIFVMTAMTDLVDELKEMQHQGFIQGFVIKPFVFSEQFVQAIRCLVTG